MRPDVMLDVQRVTDFATLQRLRRQWNRVCNGNPLRRFEWLGSWASSYLREDQLYVLTAFDEGHLVGLLPLYRNTSTAGGFVLRWLGSGEVCTDYLGVCCQEGREQAVTAAFAAWLTEASASANDRWDLLQLENVDAQESTITELRRHLSDQGCVIDQRDGLQCWRIDLPDTWDEYVTTLSKSHRKKIRRIAKTLDQPNCKVVHASSPDEFQLGMNVFVDLHQKRRESLGQSGCFASDKFRTFIHRAGRELHDAGLLRLTWIEMDGSPLSAEFQLTSGGLSYAYQAGVDPDRLDMQPGRLAMIATIRDAIADRQSSFDFLRGDEPYKAHWRADPRPAADIRIVAPTTTGQVRHQIWRAGTSLKGLVQSTLSLGGVS